jgi:amino acid transporter
MFPSAAGEYEYTRQAMPEWVAFTVGWAMIAGLVTTTNTTLLAVTAASRVMYGTAAKGVMPRSLAFIHPGRGTPTRAIVAVGLVAAVFAVFGDFAVIAAVADFAVYVVFSR